MNFFLLLYFLLILPKMALDRWRGKRHPALLQRLGFKIPDIQGPVIWIHAVSVGEVKAVESLFYELRQKFSGYYFLVTTTTYTGQTEAKKTLQQADAFSYLPLDFSWVVRRWVKKINPKMFVLVETDFWFHLLKELKKNSTKIVLVNGKISDRAFKRYRFLLPWAKKLFSHFDLLCVQNKEYADCFFSLVPEPFRICITGNLKFDAPKKEAKEKLLLPERVVTISCTHAGEEEAIVNALQELDIYLIIAPRHPERFEGVAKIFKNKKKILVWDKMGELPTCYAHSSLVILGGSFVDGIGGHNLLEPCLYGVPVFFGSYAFKQKELADKMQEFGAGKQMTISELRENVENYFSHTAIQKEMRAAATCLIESCRGATMRTMDLISKIDSC